MSYPVTVLRSDKIWEQKGKRRGQTRERSSSQLEKVNMGAVAWEKEKRKIPFPFRDTISKKLFSSFRFFESS